MSLDEPSAKNRTIILTDEDVQRLRPRLWTPPFHDLPINKTVVGDCFDILRTFEGGQVDCLILDPFSFIYHYFLKKEIWETEENFVDVKEYGQFLDTVIKSCIQLLKPDAAIYVCGDWHSSGIIQQVLLDNKLKVRSRITWEKQHNVNHRSGYQYNCTTEDVWFATVSNDYKFNVDMIKTRKKRFAHRNFNQKNIPPWERGKDVDVYASTFWGDITVPFYRMAEHTEHPHQKGEKLFAKLILASTNPGDLVLDPFLGSGTTSVVAKKLNRNYIGIELHEKWALVAERRLEMADSNPEIFGYRDGIFWERGYSFT